MSHVSRTPDTRRAYKEAEAKLAKHHSKRQDPCGTRTIAITSVSLALIVHAQISGTRYPPTKKMVPPRVYALMCYQEEKALLRLFETLKRKGAVDVPSADYLSKSVESEFEPVVSDGNRRSPRINRQENMEQMV